MTLNLQILSYWSKDWKSWLLKIVNNTNCQCSHFLVHCRECKLPWFHIFLLYTLVRLRKTIEKWLAKRTTKVFLIPNLLLYYYSKMQVNCTVKLGYNDHGYNEHTVITDKITYLKWILNILKNCTIIIMIPSSSRFIQNRAWWLIKIL